MARPRGSDYEKTIQLIKEGRSIAEIARELGISKETVKSRRRAYLRSQSQSENVGNGVLTQVDPQKAKAAQARPSKSAPPPSNGVITQSDVTAGKVVRFAKPEKKKSQAKKGTNQAQTVSEKDAERFDATREELAKLLNFVRTLPTLNVTDLRKLIWLEIQATCNPAVKIQGYNAIMRAIALEQKLPADHNLDNIDAATMTNLERERLMEEIMARGDLSGA
ncbi:MAG: helix-turn-helix domain-containing protein [Cyanobacteria bacterium P01_B01_bin.77]